jgi:IclR family acetate operon transcriptional repressor
VQSVTRALTVVEYLAAPENSGGLALGDIASKLGVSKSAAHALLATLRDAGYVSKVEPGPRYLLGMSLMRLGERVRERMPLADLAHPVLQSLAQQTGLTARLVLADQGQPLYVSRVEGAGSIRFAAQIGKREYPHSTGVGKAILATMDPSAAVQIAQARGMVPRTRHTITDPETLLEDLRLIRTRGYAIDQEEEAEGIVCVAASIHDAASRCLGAISVSGLKVSLDKARVSELGATVKDHAARLSELVGAS